MCTFTVYLDAAAEKIFFFAYCFEGDASLSSRVDLLLAIIRGFLLYPIKLMSELGTAASSYSL